MTIFESEIIKQVYVNCDFEMKNITFWFQFSNFQKEMMTNMYCVVHIQCQSITTSLQASIICAQRNSTKFVLRIT